jgi:hypothetical protein
MHSKELIVTLCAALGAALVLITAPSQAADSIYKSVDADGHVTYSDHPLSAASQVVSVNVPQADRKEAARVSKEQAIFNSIAAQSEHQQSLDKKQKEELRRRREQRCTQAKNRVAELHEYGRVYRRDEQGNRLYYSDAELAGLRSEAKKVAEDSCDD